MHTTSLLICTSSDCQDTFLQDMGRGMHMHTPAPSAIVQQATAQFQRRCGIAWDCQLGHIVQAAQEGDDVEDSGAEDGVYLFRPHTSYISGLR